MTHPARHAGPEAHLWHLLSAVPDPEIPVLSIVDLGIVRHVRCSAEGGVSIGLTPTYSGCPATEVIRDSVRRQLDAHGYAHAVLEEVLSPPWSSEWLTAAGRAKLARFGIAPPVPPTAVPACPRCHSRATERLSEFGSTPCKSHHRCRACGEPFDHFKCI
ncbi:MAG: phenylacetate-CoA oxygenase subunit PaaJ [Proteobacteria bacterium]|nr:phenylacetate-CoA oxygenase subunit PaaJ [Pseudomonadota bacterium]